MNEQNMLRQELSIQMGKNIRQLRKENGLTQEQLAEACDFSAAYCAQLETGARLLSISKLVQMAEVLHTSAGCLIYGKVENERILHIVDMLSTMSENDVAFVEKIILSTLEWMNQR